MTENYRLNSVKPRASGLGVIVSAFVLGERGKDARIYQEDGCWFVESKPKCGCEDHTVSCNCDPICREHDKCNHTKCNCHSDKEPCNCDNDCRCDGHDCDSYGNCSCYDHLCWSLCLCEEHCACDKVCKCDSDCKKTWSCRKY